jgi:hypothetical protein
MLVVEAPDLAQKLGRPAAEEDCRRECWGSSTMSTLPEVDAPWATQMSDQSATEEDCMGEHWPASPMGEDVRRQPPPPMEPGHIWSRGCGRGATRCSCHCCEGQRWWCRYRNHHGRHCHGFRYCRAAVVGTTGVMSGRRWSSKVVAQHTRGRCSRGMVGWQTPRFWE